jgi:hypothetical protein
MMQTPDPDGWITVEDGSKQETITVGNGTEEYNYFPYF